MNGFLALVLCGGALLVGACEPELVPNAPTFADHIKPLMLSRCVRCHGGGGKLNADRDQMNAFPGAPRNGFFDRLDNPSAEECAASGAAPGTTCVGLGSYAEAPATILKMYIHSTDLKVRMPPPPAPALTSHQLETLDNWLAEANPH